MNRRAATARVVLVAALALASPLAARPADLSWQAAFPVDAAKSEVYLDARFVGADGAAHRLQLWRRGSERLHRRTDEVIDLYVGRAGSDYQYQLVDHRRHLAMSVDRNHLYRVGVFADWFGLAHVLDRPKGSFRVRATAPLPGERRSDCVWRILEREHGATRDQTRICWSGDFGLPLVIRTASATGAWVDTFTAARLEQGAMSDTTVLPDVPAGYASFDANSEIAPEAGD